MSSNLLWKESGGLSHCDVDGIHLCWASAMGGVVGGSQGSEVRGLAAVVRATGVAAHCGAISGKLTGERYSEWEAGLSHCGVEGEARESRCA